MIREFPKQPAATGRLVMRQARKAVLAGIGHKAPKKDGGWPRASLVTTACDHDGPPILLLSDIALHSRDLKDDNRVSLLFDAADGHANPQQAPRISVMGRVKKTKDTDMGRRFLARHPGATLYAPFGDFNFFRMEMACAHYVVGRQGITASIPARSDRQTGGSWHSGGNECRRCPHPPIAGPANR